MFLAIRYIVRLLRPKKSKPGGAAQGRSKRFDGNGRDISDGEFDEIR